MTMDKAYDVVIIGGGPAGLTAGLYATRAGLKTLLIEKGVIGGQIANAELVENYPGFPDGISGFELGQLMHQQAMRYGLETIGAEVVALEPGGKTRLVRTSDGEYVARAVIIAGGSELSKLGIPREERLTGKGVSYCATCDGPLFKDKTVAVVGGGDAAITEALVLAKLCSKIFVIHRRNQLRASRILQERAFAEPRIEFIWDTVVDEIIGDERLEALKTRNVKTGEVSTLNVSAVFIYIGFSPNTGYLKGLVPLDSAGLVITNERMETTTPGIFACGDIRHNSAKQAITAAGDGATAAMATERFVREQG